MPVPPVGPEDLDVVIKFGGGLNTRASEDEVKDRECVSGQNFVLDLENMEFRNREYFDLADTAPNAGQINGFAQLQQIDGTLTTLIQAGTNVYSWTGFTFTLVGTVTSGTKMRGDRNSHFWPLDDLLLIPDVAGINPVMTWDGVTLANMSHNLGGSFIAKYCFVERERAHFANVISNGTSTPHLIAGSTAGDYTTLSVSDKPSSSLGASDPWYLLTPDLKPINGIVSAFGTIIVSAKNSKLFKIDGIDATDFAIDDLYPGSNADGDESLIYVGNDIAYGRQGRIESVFGTLNYGDVETDDLSRFIQDQIKTLGGWTAVYNARLQRAYFSPSAGGALWVAHKPILDEVRRQRTQSLASGQSFPELSPWSLWNTNHALQFTPTCFWSMLDPIDGFEYAWMGDASGNIYRLEGSSTGDGDSADVKCIRRSKVFTVPLDADAYDVEGYIQYRKNEQIDLTLKLLYSGTTPFDQTIAMTLAAISNRPVYSGGLYYSDGNYYSTPFKDRFVRRTFGPAGQSTNFQIELQVEGTTQFAIGEVGLKFQAAA